MPSARHTKLNSDTCRYQGSDMPMLYRELPPPFPAPSLHTVLRTGSRDS